MVHHDVLESPRGATVQAEGAGPAFVADVTALAIDLRRWLATGARSPSGAIVAWVDHGSGERAFDYPEISGYALTHFAGSGLQGDDLELEIEAGLAVARWLEGLIDEGQLAARKGWDGQAIYNFDIAMMANGLMTFGGRFGHRRMVESGVKLASRLADQVGQIGYLPAIDEDLSTTSRRSSWSTEGFAHLIKPAQCLMTAAGLGLEGAEEAAAASISKGLNGQKSDGRFETRVGDDTVMLHPHLYAVEGLWAFGRATSDKSVLDRARQATEWAFQHLLPSGGLPRYVNVADGSVGPEQFDATSQLLRAAVLLELDVDLTPTVDRLRAVALPVPGQGRAMPYSADRELVHRNAWVSMFAAQALELYCAGSGSSLDWRHLV